MELDDKERSQLLAILQCADEQLDARLADFTAAATEEYLRMVLGQRVFTRGQDVLEYRLLLLISRVFGGKLPTEQQISALFQTSATQSRALLRAVMSKYQYELQAAVEATLAEIVADAETREGQTNRFITIDSENVIDALNRRIAARDGSLPQVSKSRGTVTTYEIAPSSYAALSEELGVAGPGDGQ